MHNDKGQNFKQKFKLLPFKTDKIIFSLLQSCISRDESCLIFADINSL